MKTSILTKLALGAVMALSMGLAACAKKGESSVRVAKRGGEITTSSTCSTGASSVGRIYNQSNQAAFESAVKIFVSTTLPGTSFGSIDASGQSANGVFLTMNLRFDSSGKIDKSASKVLVQIKDSFVGQVDSATGKEIPAYEVQFVTAYAGTLNKSARTFNVTFQDNLGWIAFSGTYDNNNAWGNVYFQNYSSVDGSSLAQQTMGSFWVPSCGLFN
ncbi:hypothetical protein B9G69_013080 [Bdellovibrio sp. SKB1291214]|uniref:hypothetical protein n=1 Tax=Bdellovibrio sp. SKB1291214 TaxID=1732569 RepID=UPI000B51B3D8|nr:hypothetical protein [Bdellovibrio sp. SKB1291214]UYL07978.1 hypothetical protein B9G69_013080 [Bdellovibrio sp. SKB1291214]